MANDEFNKKFGWLMLAKAVADFKNTDFDTVMGSPAIDVFVIATLLKERVELIQSK